MKYFRVVNVSKGYELAQKAHIASTLVDRTIGLLGTNYLSAGEALWIAPCHAIHTFFMRYPIDVIFLSRNGSVLHQKTLVPWRFSRWVARARGVLELPAGTLERTQTAPGDRIEMKGDR